MNDIIKVDFHMYGGLYVSMILKYSHNWIKSVYCVFSILIKSVGFISSKKVKKDKINTFYDHEEGGYF